jgi:ER lumen protein retaining receptor
MTWWQFFADMLHLASFFLLLLRLHSSKNTIGISLKTQELYLLVFCTRYLDVFSNTRYAYLVLMKILYISLTGYSVYLFRAKNPWKRSYDEQQHSRGADTFFIWRFAVLPCAILAVLVHHRGWWFEIFWAFSEYLEAIAIVPQIIVISRNGGEVENITSHYIAALGGYRLLYLFNWAAKWRRNGYIEWIASISGLVQTILYADFFYYYYKAQKSGAKMKLPSSRTDL